MHNKRISFIGLLLLFSGLMLSSCNKRDFGVPPVQQNKVENNSPQVQVVDDGSYHAEIIPAAITKMFVETDPFLSRFNGMDSVQKAHTNKPLKKTVRDIITLRDNRNNAALHIVNYKEGGWVILSAEQQATPLLAYNNEGTFDVNDKENVAVNSWIENFETMVEKLRSKEKSSSAQGMLATDNPLSNWKQLFNLTKIKVNGAKQPGSEGEAVALIGPGDGPDPEPNPCNSGNSILNSQAGPMLKTQWNQTGGDYYYPFNYYVPNKAAAGCSPVAIGQIMKYWQFPSNMYWAGVATGNISTGWTAWLLWDSGVHAGTTYGATPGSTSPTKDQGMVNALKYYGYSYVSLQYGFNGGYVISNLPVILNGNNSSGAGHSWVCDGYQLWTNPSCGNGGAYYYHMNWGHGGSEDGYFTYLGQYGYTPRMIFVRP